MRFALPALHRDQKLVFAAFLLWGFGTGLWLQLQPLYIEQLGADPRQIGAALGIPGLAVLFMYIPMGLLADRQQRRKPFIVAAWATGTLATLLMAVAPNWRWVIPGIALYLFSSFSRPVLGAYIASTDRQGDLGRLFALLSVGYSVGSIVGPALGGLIAEAWGLRSVLYIATGFNLLSTGATLLLGEHPAPAPVDGAAQKPSLRAVLADRPFLWQMLVLALITFSFDLGTLLAPTYLQDVKGLSLAQIGQMGTVASVGMMLFMITMGQLRPERRLPLLVLQLAVAAALALLLASPGRGGAGFFLVLGLAYFCRGAVEAIWPTSRSRVALWVAPQALSLGFGVLDTSTQLARTIAPFAAGFLYDRSPALPLLGGLAALGVTVLLTLTLPQRRPRPLAEAAAGG